MCALRAGVSNLFDYYLSSYVVWEQVPIEMFFLEIFSVMGTRVIFRFMYVNDGTVNSQVGKFFDGKYKDQWIWYEIDTIIIYIL